MTTPPRKAFGKVYSLWDTVKTFHYCMKAFGFANFSIEGNINNGKIKSTLFDILWFIFISLTTIYLIYLNWIFNLSLITTTSRVINVGSRLVLLFQITNVLFSCILMFIRRHQIWGIFHKCFKFDDEMTDLKMSLDHRRYFLNFLLIAGTSFVIFSTLSFASVYYLMNIIDESKSYYLISSYLTINASMTTSLLTISFILFAIYSRFELINSSIKKFFVTEEEDEQKATKSSEVLCKIVAKLADEHDSLVDIVNGFNHCFSFQLMNDVAAMFLTNIFSIFAIYRVFVRYDTSQYEQAIVQYTWNTYFLIYGFAIVTLASLATRTGKYTAVLVHKAVNYIVDDDDPIIDYLKMFSQQMQHRSPVVSCGLFTFDFTLVFTFIGATATYIVILIQFDTDIPTVGKNFTIGESFANLTTLTTELTTISN